MREVTGGNHRSSGFGIITFARGLGAAAGPPLGGVLVHLAGWSSIFWVNVPVTGIALLLGWSSLPRRDAARAQRTRFDWSGSILLALALSALIAIPTVYEKTSAALALMTGVMGLALGRSFARRELSESSPVVNLRLFRHRPFACACASVLFATCGELGGRLADRRGRSLPLIAGALCLVVGVVLAAGAFGTASVLALAGALAVMGVGLGMPDAAMQEAAFEPVPAEHAGVAGGAYTTVRYLGITTGTTIFTIAFVTAPRPGESDPFVALFAGLVLVALAGLAVTWRVARWQPAPAS